MTPSARLAAEVGKVVSQAALATGAAAPVVAGGLVANQLYEHFGEEPPGEGEKP